MGKPQGYLPEYTVEDCGYRTPCWILPATHSAGYARITVDGKRVYAHRAVYEAVKGPIPSGKEPDHLCRQRACCRWDHLEAVTRSTNVRRGARAKLTAADVRVIRAASECGARRVDLARRFGVSAVRITLIVQRKEWATV